MDLKSKDSIKILVDFYKNIIMVLITALFGVFAYSYIHYKAFESVDFYLIIAAAVLLGVILCLIVRQFIIELKRLDKS